MLIGGVSVVESQNNFGRHFGSSSLLAESRPVIVQNLLFDRSVNVFAALNALDMCYLCKIQLRL